MLTPIVEPVRKYAHWITIRKEALEDIAGIRSFIDSRLRYGLALEDRQRALNGSATPPSLVGLFNRTARDDRCAGRRAGHGGRRDSAAGRRVADGGRSAR